MRCFVFVSVQSRVRLGEILTVDINTRHYYTETLDVLISIPVSKDYSVLEVDREQALAVSPVMGEHQVRRYGNA